MTLVARSMADAVRRTPLGQSAQPAQPERRTGVPELVLAHLLQGEELAAELTARLAAESDYSLADIYDALRAGVYRAPALATASGDGDADGDFRRDPGADAEALRASVLDEQLVRLAARLEPAPRRHRDPQAVVLTTTRRGVAACICHLFGMQGVPALSLELAEIARRRRGGAGIGRQFSAVRYVIVDGAGAKPEELLQYVGLLRQLHLAGAPFTVLVLGDHESAVRSAALQESSALTFVSKLSTLMAAAGVTAESPLTPRERAVLEFVSEGATNQQIATALGISLATVKTYLERAQVKLKTCDRASAVATAMRRGWI
ncbi:MAG TPA: LuxR C-terminal-related transcriptional regulator [Frankiaceae bacterium]|jgi:DNA-binding CsgD family transcriptional regulator|nr:LuxR C-terminal-related transcriptional regulator [Frankiaceae bacterium]